MSVMILAHHLIFSAYGFWLPNDPRGSGSHEVRADGLKPFGPATPVTTRQSVAAQPHDWELRVRAKSALSYPAVLFDDEQILAIAAGFEEQGRISGYRIYACSVMPDHAHLVVAPHTYAIKQVGRLLKQKATTMLDRQNLNPMRKYALCSGKSPSPWAQDFWKVFLFDDEGVQRCIRYVEENPVKAGRPRQCWSFLVKYPE